MKVYFDTEFTGLHKDTTLVSIGLVSEDGRSFYAELNDYDRLQTDDWFRENVEANLIYNKPEIWNSGVADIQILGNKKEVCVELIKWLNTFETVQLVSDVCHYDMVLFIDLFGNAFNLPKNVNPCCHDINQDIAHFQVLTNNNFNFTEADAFDINREQMLSDAGLGEIPNIYAEKYGGKHNSLYDAHIIKLLSETVLQTYFK